MEGVWDISIELSLNTSQQRLTSWLTHQKVCSFWRLWLHLICEMQYFLDMQCNERQLINVQPVRWCITCYCSLTTITDSNVTFHQRPFLESIKLPDDTIIGAALSYLGESRLFVGEIQEEFGTDWLCRHCLGLRICVWIYSNILSHKCSVLKIMSPE